MKRHLLFWLMIYCTSCYDSSFDTTPVGQQLPTTTTTLAALGEDLNEQERMTITTDLVVQGRVSSSDQSGNFYRTLCIESEGAAAELMAGIDALHNDYPIGTRLVLTLKGLAIGRRMGVLQIGRPTEQGSFYPTDYLGSKAALDRHCFRSADPLLPPTPTCCSIPELNTSWCGLLIRIDGVRAAPETVTENRWGGYQRFVDQQGNVIYTSVRDYADFAEQELPIGACSLTGILYYDPSGEGRYLIKLRDETDCQQ